MGGDQAPSVNVMGAVQALKFCTEDLVLVGKKEKLCSLLEKVASHISKKDKGRIRIENAEESINMEEHAASAVRSKKDSSINVGIKKAAEAPNSAFVSAGHSGAVLASSILNMKRISGVERPAIAISMPSSKGRFLLIDGGANAQCRSSQLVQFALLGHTYSRICLPDNPGSVGILSNGVEESKGIQLTFEAHEIMKRLVGEGLFPEENYLGLVEGKHIFDGKINVVVCDGFTGNILLKALEGFSGVLQSILVKELKRDIFSAIGGILVRKAFERLRSQMDYQEVGGAPLLGLQGRVFISHGSSTAKAIKNAILQASKSLKVDLMGDLSKIIMDTKSRGSKDIGNEQ